MEKLLWAIKIKSKVERKILIIISDGAPVDDSTLSANSSNILDDHLKVVQSIERDKSLKLLAIGIGHDVSKYYSVHLQLTMLINSQKFIDKLVIIKKVQSI